jgi:hypothetical protein
MTLHCRNHCRACGSHFTSVRAFDAHRVGPMSDRRCEFGPDLIEIPGGVCRIGDPEAPRSGILLYEHKSTANAREVFGLEGAQTERTQRKQVAAA